MTYYYVDPGRTANGDGSETNPWKLWGNIVWATIATALGSDHVTIYFSSRATESSAGSFSTGTSGNATYQLTLSGNEKYNLTAAGNAVWLDETISTNKIILTNSGGSGGDMKVPNGSSYITIRGFKLNQPTWSGIMLAENNPTENTHDITVEYCYIDTPTNNHGIYGGAMETGCKNIIVRYNTVIETDLEGIYLGHYNYITDTMTGCIVEYNTLIDCGLSGQGDIDIKPPCYGAIVRYNTHYRTAPGLGGTAAGVVVAADACQIYGNRFYDLTQSASPDWGMGIYINSEGDAAGNPKAVTSCRVYNNLIYGCLGGGIAMTATNNGYDLTGVEIVGNTIVSNGWYGISLWSGGGAKITVSKLYNNIIKSNTLYEVYLLNSDCTISLGDYNCYNRAAGNSWYYRGAEKTWVQWQALGFDAHGINTDPLFADEASDDYSLQFGSPCKDTGMDAGSPFGIDIDEKTRPIGAGWDMGAFEYGSNVAPYTRIY